MSISDLFKTGYAPYTLPPSIFSARDRRIDCLRGIAVMGISANHIWPEGLYSTQYNYKFGHLFAFDFADVFILLSGIVAGLVFFPILVRDGPLQCFRKSARRARQIWSAQVLCVLAALPVILIFEQTLGVNGSQISPFKESVTAGFAGNILLYNPSILLDILPLYIMLLLALPLALALFRRSPLAYFTLTGGIWAAIWTPLFLMSTGVLPRTHIPLEHIYFIHPLTAQLLFFIGVAIGIRKRETEAFLSRHSRPMLIGAVIFLVITNYMHQVVWMVHYFDHKQFTGPLRLAELLAVMTVLWCLIRPNSFNSPKVGLVEACGRHTLPVFAITTVGAILLHYLLLWLEAGRLIYGLCILANISLCLTSGHLLERHRAAQKARLRSEAAPYAPRKKQTALNAQTA